jgi:uncharacterized protein (DUF1697 family)
LEVRQTVGPSENGQSGPLELRTALTDNSALNCTFFRWETQPLEIFIALVRGINVGRAKRVAMAELRNLITDLGYDHVRTLLNSGNVVFAGERTGRHVVVTDIEGALTARLGIEARVLVFTKSELDVVISENTLLEVANNPSRLLVTFFSDSDDPKRVEPLGDRDWTPEALALGSRVAYLWCPEGVLASRLPGAVEKAAAGVVTTRNWSTVTKLHTLSEQVRAQLNGSSPPK